MLAAAVPLGILGAWNPDGAWDRGGWIATTVGGAPAHGHGTFVGGGLPHGSSLTAVEHDPATLSP